MQGLHIIGDWHQCPSSPLLHSADALRVTATQACLDAGLTVLGAHFFQFARLGDSTEGGATGAVILAESHLAIHTWPERAAATLDVYVCNLSTDNSARAERVYATLRAAFAPGAVVEKRLERGVDATDAPRISACAA